MKGGAGVARFGGVGDNLVAASTLRPLKRMGYNTEIITSPLASVVYLNNPFLDKISVKGDGDLPGGENWQKWFVSRGREYDVFAHLSHSMEVRHALFPDSTAFWTRPEYRRKLCAGNYLETVCDIVGCPYDFGPLYFPTEEEKDRAVKTREQVGGPYLAWVIAGSRPDKVYPYTSHAISRIIKELDISVVLIGAGSRQIEMAKVMSEDVKYTLSSTDRLHWAITPEGGTGPDGQIIRVDPGGANDWSLRRSLAQAMLADVVVTPDTGIAWAVAFEEMPKIALMSHASEENITKHWVNTVTLHADVNRVPCWPCHRLHNDLSTCTPAAINPQNAACMADISVETVMEQVRKALNKDNVLKFPRKSAA